MNLTEVPLERIDVADEKFRISEDLRPGRLKESLLRAGQLNPVHLWRTAGERWLILCGFRRLRLMEDLGFRSAIAVVWEERLCDPLRAFRLALWENLAHRHLDSLENARVLYSLKNRFGVGQDQLVAEFLPILGLKGHKNVLRSYLALHTLGPPLRNRLLQGQITVASAARLSEMDALFQNCVNSILDRVRWSASMQREVLELLEELAAILDSSGSDILQRGEVSGITGDENLTPAQRGESVRNLLYRWRNPRISAARERFESERERLELPAGIRLSPDPFFETPRVRVEFEASTAESFRRTSEALLRSSRSPALDELFQVH